MLDQKMHYYIARTLEAILLMTLEITSQLYPREFPRWNDKIHVRDVPHPQFRLMVEQAQWLHSTARRTPHGTFDIVAQDTSILHRKASRESILCRNALLIVAHGASILCRKAPRCCAAMHLDAVPQDTAIL